MVVVEANAACAMHAAPARIMILGGVGMIAERPGKGEDAISSGRSKRGWVEIAYGRDPQQTLLRA